MTRGEMMDMLSWLVSFNDGQTNQDFTSERLLKLLQLAYQNELNKAVLQGSKAWFKMTYTFTWPASQVTLAAPDIIKRTSVYSIQDITNEDPGPELQFDDRGLYGLRWVDRSTLQWGVDGPSSARSLRVEFVPQAETMANDDEEPLLIPPAHHELLVYSAAVTARFGADEGAPGDWKEHLRELRMDYWKFISKGRPFSDTPVVQLPRYDGTIGLSN